MWSTEGGIETFIREELEGGQERDKLMELNSLCADVFGFHVMYSVNQYNST